MHPILKIIFNEVTELLLKPKKTQDDIILLTVITASALIVVGTVALILKTIASFISNGIKSVLDKCKKILQKMGILKNDKGATGIEMAK